MTTTDESPTIIQPQVPAPKRKPWLRRTRTRMIVARTLGWGFIGLVGLVATLYVGIRGYLTPGRIKDLLVEQAAAQTGGRMSIGAVEFDVLSGLRLIDVTYTPPLVSDSRGVLAGGALEPKALAAFKWLRIEYSIPKLLAGRVEVRALQLGHPDIYLKQTDGVFNFAGIMAFRAEHFPPKQELAGPPAPPPPPPPGQVGKGLLPFDPSLIYLPFHLLVQNVGLENLALAMVKEEKGRVTQEIRASGLSLDLGLVWSGNISSIWFNSMSTFERPLALTIDAEAPPSAAATGAPLPAPAGSKLVRTLSVQSALAMRFELAKLTRATFQFNTRLIELATPAASYRDLGTYVKIALNLTDDLKGVRLETVDAEIADALSYTLAGLVSVADNRFEQITLKLKQQLHIDLRQVAVLAKPFMPELKATGEIALEDFKINGTIEPEKLKAAANDLILPYVSGTLWLREVFVDLPKTGVAMAPLVGSLSIAAGPALSGGGSQVDLALDLNLPKLKAERETPLGLVSAGVLDFTTKVTARALWPQMVLPILKVNVQAAHVLANGPRIAPVDVPLFVDIDAEGRKDLERLALNASLELTGLAELNAMADCQASCTRIRSSLQARLNSLAKLHAMVLPLAETLKLGEVMPTRLSGAVDFQAVLRGSLPNPLTTPPKDLVEQADVQFSTQLNVSKLTAKLPLDQIDLKGFETRFQLAGSTHEQKLDLTQKFDSLALVLPKPQVQPAMAPAADLPAATAGAINSPAAAQVASTKVIEEPATAGDDKPPQQVEVERFAFDMSIDNDVDGAVDISQINELMHRISTKIDTKLFIGKVAMPGMLPNPLSALQLTARVSQEHMNNVALQDLTLRLPDFGTAVALTATAGLGADFQPQRFQAKLDTQIVHNGEEKLPGGIKTSGRMGVKLAVSSDDMRNVAVDGYASFQQFNALVPGKEPNAPALLSVEKINGQIPFKQLLKLPPPKSPVLANSGPAAPVAVPVATVEKSEALPEVLVANEGDEPVDSAAVAMNRSVQKYLLKSDNQSLSSSNLVATVDYGSIRPFYPERRPLSIQRLEVANLEFSKMEFDMELRQNWFALNQFVIGFLGGKIEGDFQLAFDASNPVAAEIPQNLRTSIHLTRLDTRKLIERFPNLSGKASSSDLFSNPYIDATLHLVFDIGSSDISGGLDISSIGKEQLRMILYFADPYEQNPTIGDIRNALAFGDVRKVAIPLKNGEVGMDVDLRVLGAPVPLPKLSHFPISQLLQNVKDQSAPAAKGAG